MVVPTSPPLEYVVVAETQRDDLDLQRLLNEPTTLQLQQIETPGSRCLLWCDVLYGQPHPYIPQQYRRQVFLHYHSLTHPRIRGTQRIIGKRVVWPYMKRDFQQWTCACIPCQISKAHRHVKTPLQGSQRLPSVSTRFTSILWASRIR